tara:strand:- start:3460 stop:4137 length:678 start_codon:yes stop_codon:yes gene_type:complete
MIILGAVYFNYFVKNNKISLENNNQESETEISKNIPKKNGVKNLSEELNKNITEKSDKNITEKSDKNIDVQELKAKKIKPKIDNAVKDIEYLTTDKNGNKYKILATSGRTNSEDKNILDLDNVRGFITSKERSNIYIVSDFAEYDSSNLKSNFYQNVVINYEDKEITCDYFDVNMKTNIAIAYNNVVVTDTQSIMKAGKIILDIETKIININPENKKNKVTVTIN